MLVSTITTVVTMYAAIQQSINRQEILMKVENEPNGAKGL